MSNIYSRIRELSTQLIAAREQEDWDLVEELECELEELTEQLEDESDDDYNDHHSNKNRWS